VDSGTYPLLESAYGTLNLTNVAVRGDNVHVNGKDVRSYTFEFIVGMYVADVQSASVIQPENRPRFSEDGRFGPCGNLRHSAETDLARDGVEESHALDEKKIHAQSEVSVMGCNVRWDGNSSKGRDMWRGDGSCRLPLDGGQVRPVDDGGTFGVIRRDRTVSDQVLAQDVQKIRLGRASNLAVERASSIGIINFPSGEQPLIFRYSGYKRVGRN